jgi:hypothetical protein
MVQGSGFRVQGFGTAPAVAMVSGFAVEAAWLVFPGRTIAGWKGEEWIGCGEPT